MWAKDGDELHPTLQNKAFTDTTFGSDDLEITNSKTCSYSIIHCVFQQIKGEHTIYIESEFATILLSDLLFYKCSHDDAKYIFGKYARCITITHTCFSESSAGSFEFRCKKETDFLLNTFCSHVNIQFPNKDSIVNTDNGYQYFRCLNYTSDESNKGH